MVDKEDNKATTKVSVTNVSGGTRGFTDGIGRRVILKRGESKEVNLRASQVEKYNEQYGQTVKDVGGKDVFRPVLRVGKVGEAVTYSSPFKAAEAPAVHEDHHAKKR